VRAAGWRWARQSRRRASVRGGALARVGRKTAPEHGFARGFHLRIAEVMAKLNMHLHRWFGWRPSVTPDFRRGTKCISYVRQDQFTHI
jgi:hypothetical protein